MKSLIVAHEQSYILARFCNPLFVLLTVVRMFNSNEAHHTYPKETPLPFLYQIR
jgi:hypothetical protein